MPTASLIKVAVLVETYMQADEGKVNLRDTVTLRDADKVPGSGILTYHFSEGATFPLRDAVRLMIAFSRQHGDEPRPRQGRHRRRQQAHGRLGLPRDAHQRQGVPRLDDLGRPGADRASTASARRRRRRW